ncbi:hypothetical protein F383_21872 [Gossypium arboreum]|uniref:Uncharacterized protein n=1 Tax=Gossypium arboreum TaxID=29729 RepID=A0A0B0MRH1_GOSAR|nr:hypothetical protein F383_21872 [Gossypium arboreum]
MVASIQELDRRSLNLPEPVAARGERARVGNPSW